MTPNRKFVTATGLTAGICFLIGALGSTQLPKIRSLILVQIQNESRDHLPVRILPGAVDVSFFPLGASLTDVKVLPKDEIKSMVDPLEIKRVSASISVWQLMQGKLRFSDIDIDGSKISVRIPKSEKKGGKPLDGLFSAINNLPISQIRIDDVVVNVELSDPNLSLVVDAAHVEAEKLRNGFSLAIENASVRARDPETRADVLLEVEAALSASPARAIVESVKIRRGDSFFTASGRGSGDIEALDLKDFEVTVRSEMVLDSMRNWLTKTFQREAWTKMVPPLKGRLFADAKFTRLKNAKPFGEFSAHAENFAVEKTTLGHVELAGQIKNDLVKIPRVVAKSAAGDASIEKLNFAIKPDVISLDGHLKVPKLNVHELLYQFGVGRIPVFLEIGGDLPCTGQLKPAFALDCSGTVKGRNLRIADALGKTAATIVAVPEMDALGSFHVSKDSVTYKADLKMPDSKGRSSGEIGFETGFKVDFEADRLAFKDVTNLANLKIEGAGRIKGSTEGTSKFGKVSLLLDGSDMWFEDFWLGNAKSTISYAGERLHLADISGNAAVSRYSADVQLDLHSKTIQVGARVPFFDARDLLKIFSRRVQLSFPVLGTGQANIKASGPLDLGHLTYDLKASVFRGSVMGESFDQAHFDVKSIGGEVKTERVQASKGSALISLSGVAHPNGQIETNIHGRGIRLEDTNTIARSGFALSGAVDFEMGMNGPVLSPDTDLKGTLTRTSIGDQSMPDSAFRLKFTKNSIEGGGKFLGDVVDGDFIIPLNQTAPFKLKLATKDWNFAPLFAAVAGPSSRKDYVGLLTTDIDIGSSTGGFWNSNGQAVIEKFSLARGSLKLQNTKPMLIEMRSGQVTVNDAALSGENIFLNVQTAPNPAAKLDLLANGRLDLGLAALMTPFFEDLRGLLSFKIQVRAGNVPTQLLGTAYVDKGYLKFFDFPHAFEDVRADLLFNQQKILFNSIRSEFGGGRINAAGAMELKGPKNNPLKVDGTFDKITLNVPDKIQTSGSGDFSFSGNGFPFLLKGNYVISDGLFTKAFGGEAADSSANIRREAYLPDFLIEENFVPLRVDINIDLAKGIAVKNDYIDGRAIGSLSIKGDPTKPAIGGTLTCDRDTKVSFRGTDFEVVSANVQFGGTTEIDPKLYVSARARVETYDVNLLVQGTGQKPELLLSSVPQLPEKDIVSLLAVGATDQNLDKSIKSSDQASNTGLQVGSSIVQHNPISNAIKERTGFDVQFSTGFDETNTTVQKIVASRQITSNLGVSAGYALGKSQTTEAKIRYRLNERLSLVGAYQGNNYTETNIQAATVENTPNLFGLDVEYKFEFK